MGKNIWYVFITYSDINSLKINIIICTLTVQTWIITWIQTIMTFKLAVQTFFTLFHKVDLFSNVP